MDEQGWESAIGCTFLEAGVQGWRKVGEGLWPLAAIWQQITLLIPRPPAALPRTRHARHLPIPAARLDEL